MNAGQAIKLFIKRRKWLESQILKRAEADQPRSWYESEIKAIDLAIKGLEAMRERNIVMNHSLGRP